jgi:hypothetical protein
LIEGTKIAGVHVWAGPLGGTGRLRVQNRRDPIRRRLDLFDESRQLIKVPGVHASDGAEGQPTPCRLTSWCDRASNKVLSAAPPAAKKILEWTDEACRSVVEQSA